MASLHFAWMPRPDKNWLYVELSQGSGLRRALFYKTSTTLCMFLMPFVLQEANAFYIGPSVWSEGT